MIPLFCRMWTSGVRAIHLGSLDTDTSWNTHEMLWYLGIWKLYDTIPTKHICIICLSNLQSNCLCMSPASSTDWLLFYLWNWFQFSSLSPTKLVTAPFSIYFIFDCEPIKRGLLRFSTTVIPYDVFDTDIKRCSEWKCVFRQPHWNLRLQPLAKSCCTSFYKAELFIFIISLRAIQRPLQSALQAFYCSLIVRDLCSQVSSLGLAKVDE